MAQSQKCKVLSVKVVLGSTLTQYWRSPMQVVETDIGTFIDNMPGVKFMRNKDVHPEFDWKQYEGQEVDDFEIIDCGGHKWINKGSK